MEFINVNSYNKFIDHRFEGKELPPPNSIVGAYTQDAPLFFKMCEENPANKYILVTYCSDFGICFQEEHHPNNDLHKLFWKINWNGARQVRSEYVKIDLTNVTEKCKIGDRYSLKIDAFTDSTFDTVPPNVLLWFSTNVNCFHPKLMFLPFGVNDEGHGKDIVSSYHKPWEEKENKIYINFQDYTDERVQLKGYYSGSPFYTVRPVKNLLVDDFYNELSLHKYVLCPFGNGFDCYRIYETLIVGSCPIMLDSRFARHLLNLTQGRIILLDKWPDKADNILERLPQFPKNEPPITITEDFWEKELQNAKKKLILDV